MRSLVLILTTLTFSAFLTFAAAAGVLSEQQAHTKAVAILKGDPYGKTYAEVGRHIRSATKKVDAISECGAGKSTVWVFIVHVPVEDIPKDMRLSEPIEGSLVIDARTGKLVCAGLPFLH